MADASSGVLGFSMTLMATDDGGGVVVVDPN